jgi:hypothetical protein
MKESQPILIQSGEPSEKYFTDTLTSFKIFLSLSTLNMLSLHLGTRQSDSGISQEEKLLRLSLTTRRTFLLAHSLPTTSKLPLELETKKLRFGTPKDNASIPSKKINIMIG